MSLSCFAPRHHDTKDICLISDDSTPSKLSGSLFMIWPRVVGERSTHRGDGGEAGEDQFDFDSFLNTLALILVRFRNSCSKVDNLL